MSAASEHLAPILTADRLSAGYGRSQVLFDLSINVPAQGAVAILGRNGAGKSTLLKTLAGELRALGGEIRFDGARANEQPTERRARSGIGYVPQEDAIFGRLSVRENLLLGASGPGGRDGIAEVLELFPKLGQRLPQIAATLSGGERKMLAIGRALLGRPRLLMLDEPTEGDWSSWRPGWRCCWSSSTSRSPCGSPATLMWSIEGRWRWRARRRPCGTTRDCSVSSHLEHDIASLA